MTLRRRWHPPVICSLCLLSGALPRPEAVVATSREWETHIIGEHSPQEIMAYSALVTDAELGQLRRHALANPGPPP